MSQRLGKTDGLFNVGEHCGSLLTETKPGTPRPGDLVGSVKNFATSQILSNLDPVDNFCS